VKVTNVTNLRRLTSSIVAGEAILLFFLAFFLIVESFISEAKNFDALIAEICFAILGGVGLLLAATLTWILCLTCYCWNTHDHGAVVEANRRLKSEV